MGREVDLEMAAALNLVLDLAEERRRAGLADAGGGEGGGESRGGVAEM